MVGTTVTAIGIYWLASLGGPDHLLIRMFPQVLPALSVEGWRRTGGAVASDWYPWSLLTQIGR